MARNIAWVVAALNNVGGGEKLLFEGLERYRNLGYTPHVFTWTFDPVCLFSGKYENRDIHVFDKKKTNRGQVFSHAFSRFRSIFELRKRLRDLNPEFVLCQSEYDVILVWLATLFTRIPYTILIFGQSYQFPHDIAKYSVIFRAYLSTIVPTMAGYREAVPMKPPAVGLIHRLANEVICIARFFAVRAAKARFTFSEQVRWETKLLYRGAKTFIGKGAFREVAFSYESNRAGTRKRFQIPEGHRVFLSLNRIEKKKRTHLVIQSYVKARTLNPLLKDSILLVGGRGPDLENLRKLVSDLNCAEFVRLLGFVEEGDVWPLKQLADVFLSLDIADFDISPYEAVSLGAKAIWTTEMDMDSNLKGLESRGVLFTVEPEQNAVAAAIVKAFESSPVWKRQEVQPYSWESYFDSILEKSTCS